MTSQRALCALADIPDGGARGFPPAPGGFTGIFAVRRGATAFVYVNACPHLGVSLDWSPDAFLDASRTHIVCSTHGAEFRIEDGFCLAGPCNGQSLERVDAQIRDGILYVPEDAGL
jgi:nitrite reductase/ring-hydroxylating ferredoxin subunit